MQTKSSMKKQFLWIIATALIFTPACKKDHTTAKTKTELISLSVWKFDNAKVSGNDVSAFLKPCEKDNTIVFNANGSGTIDEGATKCNSGDPQTRPFTWSFLTNETLLQINTPLFAGGTGNITLVTLTETQLIGSQNIDVNGTSQTAVVTFKH